jgi:ParB family chromosome partitioning protein
VQLQVAQGRISVGHAKALLSLKDQSTQLLASDQVLRKSLTVRATEKLVQDFLHPPVIKKKNGTTTATTHAELESHVRDLEDRLRTLFATQVQIIHTPKKGRIEIEYYGNDDLQRILELLGVDE